MHKKDGIYLLFSLNDSFNVRCHIVDEFNKGIYDYIIATDENLDSSKSSKCILRTNVDNQCRIVPVSSEEAFWLDSAVNKHTKGVGSVIT